MPLLTNEKAFLIIALRKSNGSITAVPDSNTIRQIMADGKRNGSLDSIHSMDSIRNFYRQINKIWIGLMLPG